MNIQTHIQYFFWRFSFSLVPQFEQAVEPSEVLKYSLHDNGFAESHISHRI
ncbi:hypothetical protein SAMN05216271_3280 [Halopseudomonas sabulinigri]|uniref:Uncharacterized protein n=1 Tax=Halopseudomonas sabulinigri TaxID=472181 RepID=A0A1H1WMY0_9GAMM|nr:hypothetical protein [Halopseudomonas sabulinigri]SDS98678.1 hypothetical protein SAMN05216271_3280 [Halopseudomonas sabulinigri]